MTFRIKRVYEKPAKADGRRILVDRVWPRGIKKIDARLDDWLRDVAPSTALRRWFGHEPERFAEFARRYKRELGGNPALAALRKLGRGHKVTLLYGAHDPDHNQAVVLLSLLGARSKNKSASKPKSKP